MVTFARVLSSAQSLRRFVVLAIMAALLVGAAGTTTPASADVPGPITRAEHEAPVAWDKPYDVTMYFSTDQMITECKDRVTGEPLYDYCGDFVPYHHIIDDRRKFGFNPIQGPLKGYRLKPSNNVRVTEMIAYYIETGGGENAPIWPRTVPPTARLPLNSTVPNPFTGAPIPVVLLDVQASGIRGSRALPFP